MSKLYKSSWKWLCLFVFLGLAISCKEEEDVVPQPSSVKIVLPENSSAFFPGEEINFVGDALNAQSFSWTANGEEFSKEKYATHTFDEVGNYDIVFSANSASGTQTVSTKIEIVNGVKVNGFGVSGEIFAGEQLSLTAELQDRYLDDYQWALNGEPVAEGMTFEKIFAKPGTHTLTFTASNATRSSTYELTLKVEARFLFTDGAFIVNEGNMSNEMGTVSFLPQDGALITNAYRQVNPGRTLGNVTQSIGFYADKAYFISQNGPNYITVADAGTLVAVDSVTETQVSLSWPTHIAVVDEQKGYIRDNNGVHIVNFAEHTLSGTVEGVSAAKDQMYIVNDKLITYSGKTLYITNTSTDVLEDQKVFEENIGTVTLDKYGHIWVAVSGSPSKMVQLSAVDFSILQQIEMPQDISLSSGFVPVGVQVSHSENAFFIQPNMAWGTPQKVYKVNYGETVSSSLLFDMANWDDDEAGISYGTIGLDPISNEVYITTIKGYAEYQTNALFVVDGTAGTRTKYSGVGSFPAQISFADSSDW
ncbi:DUF5074 domain-containing protein [Rapidithrix thailandica]|uniref:DUF5074 domain-containing protein n=1 Tax=Rapidithrix thailandica TaxID=413964 RepID=A0AAW9RVE0_9BACT